ncbi:hypothetical protein TRIP_C20743 [Candidatus Zixiibacteriota bacterium]|nr:hypothetical protein TRIP_C20743 [candidate division Zixibacteria bacterium]
MMTALAIPALGRGERSEVSIVDTAGVPISLALLPLANYTGTAEATDIFTPLISDNLKNKNIGLADPDSLSLELRKYRIRSTAAIGQDDALKLANALRVEYIMLGSINVYAPGGVPEAGLSMRVVRPSDMAVIWAVSVAASGRDYTKMLGLGEVTSIEELAQRLVEKALSGLVPALKTGDNRTKENETGKRHALVMFDNLSDNNFAGDIITMMAVSDLIENRIATLEPGAAIELFRQNGEYPRGEIDKSLLLKLNEKFGVARVITGSVDLLRPSGGTEAGTPEVELGGRYLDAATGKVLGAVEIDRRGTDSETIFKLGITYSLGQLAQDATHNFLEKLHVFEK